jgi:hypothetical protein
MYVDHAVVVRGVPKHDVRGSGGPRHGIGVIHARHGSRSPEARLATMTKWEYMTAPVLVHATKQILDNFGEDGWELVQMVPGMNPENLVAYFKRAKS